VTDRDLDAQPPVSDEMRGSHRLTDVDTGADLGRAYAEAVRWDAPVVSIQLPADADGWVDVSPADALALGSLLSRIGGAAQGYERAQQEFAILSSHCDPTGGES
jgi:hypothetical protein